LEFARADSEANYARSGARGTLFHLLGNSVTIREVILMVVVVVLAVALGYVLMFKNNNF
jgi:hypothetical protein